MKNCRQLKIAFLSFPHIGPYLEFFQQRGHQLYLFAYDRLEKDYGVPVFDISFGAQGYRKSSKWKYFLAGIALKKHLRRINPDILHGHYVTSAGVISAIAGFKPLVLTAHGTDLIASENSLVWKSILKCTLNRADLVNVVSDQLEAIVLKLGVNPSKILNATFGVDTQKLAFKPFFGISAPLKLLCTRTLGKTYDPFTIVNACKILKQKNINFRLTFAASGRLESEVKKVVQSLDLHKQIIFLGGYSSDQLPQLIHQHDIYISASHWDGTSISLLEAMACGIFPIVSRTPSNLAWLKENETSLMFDCANSGQLAEKIQQCVKCPDFIPSALNINRRLVEQKADCKSYMLKLEQKYYEIISK
jgi:glycosyltransferase involved in cell wall biosynthesis